MSFFRHSHSILSVVLVALTLFVGASIDTIPSSNYRPEIYIPAEYEPVSAVIVSWPSFPRAYWTTYANLVAGLVTHTPVIILVREVSEQSVVFSYLQKQGVDAEQNITFWHLPFESIWIRDYGPLYLVSGGNTPQISIVGTRYEPLYRPRMPQNDTMPEKIAVLQGYKVKELDLVLEGGNILSDGHGTCFATTTIYYRNTNYSTQEIREMMQHSVGCHNLIVLPALHGEPTGHIGLILKILSPDTLLVGQCTAKEDRNCQVLDDIAIKLSTMTNYTGQQYKVVRIPYPFIGTLGQDRLYASYVNSIIVNESVFVPAFGLPEDDIARQMYQDALPSYTIVPVDTSPLLRSAGAIQCITVTIPDIRADSKNNVGGATDTIKFHLNRNSLKLIQ